MVMRLFYRLTATALALSIGGCATTQSTPLPPLDGEILDVVPWDNCLNMPEEEAKAKRAALEAQRQPLGEDGPLGAPPSSEGVAPIGGAIIGADLALTYGDPLQAPKYAALGLAAGILGSILPQNCQAYYRVRTRLANGEVIISMHERNPYPRSDLESGKVSFDTAVKAWRHGLDFQVGEKVKVIRIPVDIKEHPYQHIPIKLQDCPKSRYCRPFLEPTDQRIETPSSVYRNSTNGKFEPVIHYNKD